MFYSRQGRKWRVFNVPVLMYSKANRPDRPALRWMLCRVKLLFCFLATFSIPLEVVRKERFITRDVYLWWC